MLKFNNSFFHDEYRCDFLVCEEMKRVWAVELEVLSQIINVCDKYNLEYFVNYGTLLGAVRHKGFIPWDDDIDISLKRSDYNRLFQVLPKELPDNYNIRSVFNCDNHNEPLGCVMNSKKLPLDDKLMDEFYGCPYIAGVDVYALDYVPIDPELADLQKNLYNALYDAARRFDELSESGELDIYIPKLEELCNVTFVKDDTLRHQLWMMAENVASLFTEEESDCLVWMPDRVLTDANRLRKKEWYSHSEKMRFENLEVSVPSGYDGVLKLIYGDYSVPVKGNSAHDYPFYLSQKKYLKKINAMNY